MKGPDLPVDTVHLLGDLPQGIPLEPPAAPLRRSLLEEAGKQPGSATRWILLGWSSKDARTAAIYFQRALTIEPDNPVANDGLAWAVAELAETGRLEPLTAIPAVPAHEPPSAPSAEGPLTQAPLDTAAASAQLAPQLVPVPVTTGRVTPARIPIRRIRDFRWHTITRFYQIPFFRNLAIALFYLVIISAAEIVTVMEDPLLGVIIHAVVMVALLVHGSIYQQGPFRRFLIFPLPGPADPPVEHVHSHGGL